MKHIYIFLIVMLGVFCFGPLAFAQDQAGNEGSVGGQRYESEKYSIDPPASWTLVSGNLSEQELAKLPDTIRERYKQPLMARRNSDVIYMDLSYDNRTASGFQNSLNIVSIPDQLEFNDEVIKELTSVLKEQFKAMFQSFEIQNIGIVKINEHDALQLKGSYELMDYKVIVEQVLVPLKLDSIAVTCTYDEQSSETVSEICKKTFESIREK